MPKAAAPGDGTPRASTPPHGGNAAGRQPKAAGPGDGTPRASAPPHGGNAAARRSDAAPGCPGQPGLAERVRAAAGFLAPLVEQAGTVQRDRARERGTPRWTDVFTTQFTEFSNRPR
jgi:hypothetical protein